MKFDRSVDIFLKILLTLVFSRRVAQCANILLLSNSPCFSHNIAFIGVWKELQIREHNITVVTPFPDEFGTNFSIIDVSASVLEADNGLVMSETSKWKLPYAVSIWGMEILDNVLASPGVQDLIQNHTRYKFDAVMAEIWYPSLYTFSKIFNCPLITFATIDVLEMLHWQLGNQINHVTLPDMNSGLFQADDFFDRLTSALFSTAEFLRCYFVTIPGHNDLIRKHFGNFEGDVKKLEQDMDLLLVNAHPLLRSVRAIGPTTVMVGGGNHIMPLRDLPKDLKTYLDSATNGFIYMSLGTIIQSSNIDAAFLEVLVEVLSKLPYKILWKIEDEYLQDKPANVKTIKWGPQQDILRHPNIKLFISQGGIQSLEEALFSHVPILIMPFFGDQHKNGQLVTAKGIGKMIQHKPRLDKYELENSIHELIDDPKYKNTAKRLSTLMNDTYMTGLEKSVWWIEYVIRNNGTKELRNPAAKLPFYQYYALDVIGFILSVLAIPIWLLVFIVKKILRVFISAAVPQGPESKKKR